MKKHSQNEGFTLLEIMIVVAVIGLLTLIAIPSFATARDKSQTTACINNLRQISMAKDVYALTHGVAAATIPEFVPTYIKKTPTCPASGTYTIQALTLNPTCDVTDHTL